LDVRQTQDPQKWVLNQTSPVQNNLTRVRTCCWLKVLAVVTGVALESDKYLSSKVFAIFTLWTYILYTAHFYFCFWYAVRRSVQPQFNEMTVQPHTKSNFIMTISAFSSGIAVHEYSHSYTIDKRHFLKCQVLLLVYGIAVTILVYGYTRTKSRN
jgi:hypothetical protein